jgi:hypothetical protein
MSRPFKCLVIILFTLLFYITSAETIYFIWPTLRTKLDLRRSSNTTLFQGQGDQDFSILGNTTFSYALKYVHFVIFPV